MNDKMTKRALVAGGGPAGLTAAMYLCRAGWDVKVFENEENTASSLSEAWLIENFPGFPEEISGAQLLSRMREQTVNCGAEVLSPGITSIDSDAKTAIDTNGNSHRYDEIVVAIGRTARKLEFEGSETIFQHTCAVCDGLLFKDKEVIVVGGGDTAFSEALYLSGICSKVTMLIRRDEPRISNAVVFERAKSAGNIRILWNASVVSVAEGDCGEFLYPFTNGKRRQYHAVVKIHDQEVTVGFDGFFCCIGQSANEIPVSGNGRVHYCGDCSREIKYFQAVIAAADGAKAALEIIEEERQ